MSSSLVRCAVALMLLMAACTGDHLTQAPVATEAAFAISDGAHDGVGGFFWLTPTVKKSQKNFAGTFDGELLGSVFIHVCRINGTDPETPDDCTAIRTFSAMSQPEIIRVDLDAENYSVTWQSTGENGATIEPGDILRAFAFVRLPGGAYRTLGFVDLVAVAKKRDLRMITGDFTGFVVGRPFVFKFRIEEGIAENPDIDIEKATNGVDADDPNAGDAPQIAPGSVVTWTYVVTNTGDVTLSNVTVTDDQGVAVSCPKTTLASGESMTCTASGLAEDLDNTTFTTVPGLCGSLPDRPLYENMGTADGTSPSGAVVQDTDPSHYCNADIGS